MYATQVTVRIEAGHEDEARRAALEQVRPWAAAMPGFLAGYYLAPIGETGSAFYLWQSRPQAEALARAIQPGARDYPGMTLLSIAVMEVIASAGASGGSYATQITAEIAAGREDETRRAVAEQVLPRVSALPGFVAGYWFAPLAGYRNSLQSWDTRQQAEALAARLPPGSRLSADATVVAVSVSEVIGTA